MLYVVMDDDNDDGIKLTKLVFVAFHTVFRISLLNIACMLTVNHENSIIIFSKNNIILDPI